MKAYYSERAKEYEKIYFRDDPIRQQELSEIKNVLEKNFNNKQVLEVACGTGFWTQFVAKVVTHITAIDYSNEVLDIARGKGISLDKVLFSQGDAYKLNKIPGEFNGGFANFWFSHIPKEKVSDFLTTFNARFDKGSKVFMADNVYLDSVGGTLVEKEYDENTYKVRLLENGQKFEVLKNYYDKKELESFFKPYAENLDIHIGHCFWWLTYVVK